MLDAKIRPYIDPPLNAAAKLLAPHLSANATTAFGFICGLAAFIAIANGANLTSLSLLLVARFADGLDGAIARQHKPDGTDWGGYADIVSDFLIWSLLPLAFIFADPNNAIAAAVLLSSFSMSMIVFLAFAVLAEKRDFKTDAQGRKSFYYLAGLAEGTETILFFALVCLLPSIFAPTAYVFAAFVYISVAARIFNTYEILKSNSIS